METSKFWRKQREGIQEGNLSQYLKHLKGRRGGGNPDKAIRKTFGKRCLTLLAARESLGF